MKRHHILAAVISAAAFTGVSVLLLHSEPCYYGESLSYWLAEINSPDPRRQDQARHALREIGPKAIPFLLKKASNEGSLPKRSYTAIWFSLPGSIQRYLKQPDSEDAALNRISDALHQLGPGAGPALINAMDNKNAKVRAVAGGSFPYGHDSRMAVLWDIKLLKTADYDLRQYAAGALGTLGAKARPAVPTLVEVAQHDATDYVRETAARSLAMLGPEATSGAPGLKNCLHDRSSAVRLWSAIALWRINHDCSTIPVLIADLKRASGEDGTCHAVIQVLGEAGGLAKPAMPEIRRIMRQFDPERLLPEGGADLVQAARAAVASIEPEADPVDMLVP